MPNDAPGLEKKLIEAIAWMEEEGVEIDTLYADYVRALTSAYTAQGKLSKAALSRKKEEAIKPCYLHLYGSTLWGSML
jgi:hypothetical protein